MSKGICQDEGKIFISGHRKSSISLAAKNHKHQLPTHNTIIPCWAVLSRFTRHQCQLTTKTIIVIHSPAYDTPVPASPCSSTQTMKIALINNLAAFAGLINTPLVPNAFGLSLRNGIAKETVPYTGEKDEHKLSPRIYSTGSMAPPVLDASNSSSSNSNSTTTDPNQSGGTIVGGKPVDYPRKYPVSEK